MATNFARGFWRLADPKISLASLAGILLGTAAAAADGPIAVGWLLVTILGVLAVEVAKNASGEVFDWDSGTDLRIREVDRSPFSGGKRVLVDGLLTRGQTWGIAVGGFLLAISAGLVIVVRREPGVLWLGELAVAACYGPLVVTGTYLVERGTLSLSVLLLSLPLGLLVTAFLWINEFPDYSADALSGKRTLVVRMGRTPSAHAFVWLGLAAAGILVLLPLAGLPAAVWLGGIAAFRYLPASRILLAAPEDTARIVPAQAMALQAFLLYALAASAGSLFTR